jgi:hypothetical protein
LEHPAIFWLDAHYSGGNTAQGFENTPIMSELEYVFKHNIKGHIILIDDAGDFTGCDDYPRVDYIIDYVKKHDPSYKVFVKYNIIHLLPLTIS